MCFSSPVSFAAAAVLTAAGIVGVKMAKKKQDLVIASFPFFFAIQQLSEGFIWLYLNGTINGDLPYAFGYIFNFFAQALWPFLTPLGAYLIEPNKTRRKLMLPFLIGGIICSIYLFIKITFGTISTFAYENHIVYRIRDIYLIPYVEYFYLVVVSSAFLLSSYRLIVLFGFTVFTSFVLTKCVASAAYISVWCFFAALLSLIICAHFWNQRRNDPKPQKSA